MTPIQVPLLRQNLAWFLRRPLSLGSLFVVFFYILIGLLASFGLIGSDFATTHNNQAYLPPGDEFFFGSDFLGRSVLSRVIQGTRVSLLVGFFSASLSTFLGLFLGALAGYFSSWVDDLIVWLYTTIESIPYILLISAFSFSLGQGLSNLYIALGLTGWVKLCRLIRGEFLKHKNQEYVLAAQAIGASHFRRIFKHILPNVIHLGLIQFSLSFVLAIKLEVILSYLGLGVEPGTPSWGTMINDAKAELTRGVWWNLTAATAAMFLLILSVNILTESIREFFDPKSQYTKSR
ncbi:MAG: ABC transporter permease [Pseudomonadota bacterium]